MIELLPSPALIENGVPMLRNDSGESTDSPFGSALNTPADEKALQFEPLDAKLLSVAVERGREPTKSPRRVVFPRQFSKAMEEATRISSPNRLLFRARSNSVEPVLPPEDFIPLAPHPTPVPSAGAPPLCVEEPRRAQTPQPTIQDTYSTSSPQLITRTTRPPLRRDIFSPASIPVALGVEDTSTSDVDFTPRAHSTLRHRKGEFKLLNDSITGESASGLLAAAAANDAAEATDKNQSTNCKYEDFEIDPPVLSQLSLLFPLQLVLFPAWCVLVGASIFLCPTRLNAIAFPASATRANTGTALYLTQTLLVCCLPFSAPPSPIRSFAHWATVAHLHVGIFLAALGGVTYLYPPLGALLTAACAGQIVHAWGDFYPVEDGDAELGGDVRQMLYRVLLTPGCGFEDGATVNRVGEKYFLIRAPPRVETRAEILAAAGVDDDGLDEDAE
ncbi:Protoporphyrinogen oxidase [Mycena sanguinolenta]|uniref:Protoporphyrinogen oxidase n=1 Tax=Mycena sanguinolenta TaxID=230812 RepID=A0A8H6XG06_9AGAR|nr:Protoporphyrinogen oxidase [Mycena sanguinolenta]